MRFATLTVSPARKWTHENETASFVSTLQQMLVKIKRNNYFRKWNRGDERT